MKTKLLAAFAAAIALTASLPVIQAVAPIAGTSAAFAKNGADDGPGHDANDDKGGQRAGAHARDDKGGRRGAHHVGDDKGGRHGRHGANDDHGGRRAGRR